MILRRLSSALKRQDWFQVTVEILIVVIGIFLGLQVTEWNDGRMDDLEASAYIEQLKIDTGLSIEITQDRVQIFDRYIGLIKELLQVLNGKELNESNSESFERALIIIPRFPSASIRIGHMGEVLRGDLPESIRNKMLIRAAIELESAILLELGRQQHILDVLDQSVVILHKYYAQSPTPYDEIPNIYNLGDLRESTEFKYAVQNALAAHAIGRFQTAQIKNHLEKFSTILEEIK